MRRRRSRKRRKQKVAEKSRASPDKIEVLAVLLSNVYWNGFEGRRGTSFKVARSELRALVGTHRLETGPMKRLVDRLRKEGFVFFPVDGSDYGSAQEWIFQPVKSFKDYPLADEQVFLRAESRE